MTYGSQERAEVLADALRRVETQRDRYKDALYHIAYRHADPVPTALRGLGDLPSREPTETSGS